MKFKNTTNKNLGFTLIETLIAISILTASILGLISISAKDTNNGNYAQRKVVATYLAQEGVEYIRNLRDAYVLNDAGGSQAGWNAFKTKLTTASWNALCATTNGCYFNADSLDYNNPTQPITAMTITACSFDDCRNAPIYYNSTTGKYNNSSLGVSAGFNRKISVTFPFPSANEMKISSTVYWLQNGAYVSVSFTESLYNWVE
ncbi:MAG: prepilin-type N-terminal cleavage/methylation domain-containing protein [Patescibacteria group bacterium]